MGSMSGMPRLGPGDATRMIDGERFRIIDRGAGPALLLVHGFGGSCYSWNRVLDPLSRVHRTIAVDLPGFGFSDRKPRRPLSHTAHAERLVAVMDALGVPSAVVVGHSMGGAIAQRLAANHPDRVDGLVLVSAVDASVPWSAGRRSRLGSGPLLWIAGQASRSERFVRFLVRRVLPRVVGAPSLVTGAMVEGYAAPLRVRGTVACLRTMARDVAGDPVVDLGALRTRALVVTGDRDRVVPPATSESIAAAIPGARLVTLPGVGHLPAEEQPDRLVEEILAFAADAAGDGRSQRAPGR